MEKLDDDLKEYIMHLIDKDLGVGNYTNDERVKRQKILIDLRDSCFWWGEGRPE